MSLDAEMIKQLNLARVNPLSFAALIDQQIATFINDREMPLEKNLIYQTDQGKSAWLEASAFLKTQSPLTPLLLHNGLQLSARDHATDLVKTSTFGHVGSDKSTFSERIFRFCRKGHGSLAEIIGSDFLLPNRNIAQMTILGLIVDDGVQDRGHRKTIYSSEYRYVGCKSEIQNDKQITVFNLTENCLKLKSESNEEDRDFSQSQKQRVSASSKKRNSASKENHLLHLQTTFKPEAGRCIGNEGSSHRIGDTTTGKLKSAVIYEPLKSTAQNSDRFRSSIHHHNEKRKSAKRESSREKKSPHRESALKTVQTNSMAHSVPREDRRKIREKNENVKTYHQNGCKVVVTTITLYFTDGSTDETVEKRTIYE